MRAVLPPSVRSRRIRVAAKTELRQIVSNRWASVPAHCGLSGNEKADELIKPAAKERQQDNSVTFQEKKTLIREALGQRTERDDSHFLDRWQQVVVINMTTHARATTDSMPTCSGK